MIYDWIERRSTFSLDIGSDILIIALKGNTRRKAIFA